MTVFEIRTVDVVDSRIINSKLFMSCDYATLTLKRYNKKEDPSVKYFLVERNVNETTCKY